MVDEIEILCPSCGDIEWHACESIQRQSEKPCRVCGTAIDVGMNKEWAALRRIYNARHNDGPVRRRLP